MPHAGAGPPAKPGANHFPRCLITGSIAVIDLNPHSKSRSFEQTRGGKNSAEGYKIVHLDSLEAIMKFTPYITFKGNCEEAILFYQEVLGGDAQIMRFRELPEDEGITVSKDWLDKVMHSSLIFEDGHCIYFSDGQKNYDLAIGTNFTIHVNVGSEKAVHEIVEKLSKGGKITMPAERVFWGSVFGSLTDKFGINWGIEYEIKE